MIMIAPTVIEPTRKIRPPTAIIGLPRLAIAAVSDPTPLMMGIRIMVAPAAAGGVCSWVGGSAIVICSVGTAGGAIRAGRLTNVVVMRSSSGCVMDDRGPRPAFEAFRTVMLPHDCFLGWPVA